MMEAAVSFLTEPLAFAFMQRALFLSVAVGTVCSVFSCFLVLRGWSLMGDAVSHAVLPGLALAFMAGLPLGAGAFAAGLFCALATGFIKDNSRLKEDAVMGIVFSGMFACGLILVTKIETDVHLLHILFGNVLGIGKDDILETLAVAVPVTALMVLKRRDLMLYCFDPAQALVSGLRVRVLHFGLLILLALTIVSALKSAGIILVIAMLIAPGATGFLLARTFDGMMAVAVTASVLSCMAGTLISYHIDCATAPLIVVIQSGLFVLAMAARGMLQKTL